MARPYQAFDGQRRAKLTKEAILMKSQPRAARLTRQDAVSPVQTDLLDGHEDAGQVSNSCRIVAVGRRRDGGTRYWCLAHGADATAKYGRRAATCRGPSIPAITELDTLRLHIDSYPGGVALWGAVPPVYDTTLGRLDRGIHVHARKEAGSGKVIDRTFRSVRVFGAALPTDGALVTELDAIYHMVSSVFGFEIKPIACTYCGALHLDRRLV